MDKEIVNKWSPIIKKVLISKCDSISELSIENLGEVIEETSLGLIKSKEKQDNNIREIEGQLPIIINSIMDTMLENKLEFRYIKNKADNRIIADVIELISTPYTGDRVLPSDSNIISRTKEIQVALKDLLTTKFFGMGIMELCSMVLFLSDANIGVYVCAGLRYVKNNIVATNMDNNIIDSKQEQEKITVFSNPLKIFKTRSVKIPTRANPTDAGIDFFIPDDFEKQYLKPNESILIPSGIKVNVPEGFMLTAFNKSGIATKKKLIVGACVVDNGYTGEVHIHLINAGNSDQILSPGDKIVQFILIPIDNSIIEEVSSTEELFPKTSTRGDGGFGSSGS